MRVQDGAGWGAFQRTYTQINEIQRQDKGDSVEEGKSFQ